MKLSALGFKAALGTPLLMISPFLQFENESALNLYETCKVRTIKAGTLEKLVEYLVSAFKGNDSTYVTIFLCTYRAFATTKQVLDLLLNR